MPARTAGRSWTPMTVAVALAVLAVAILVVAIATAGRGGTDAAPDRPDRDAPGSGTETRDGADEAADAAADDGDLEALPAMRDAGVDVAMLANNHTGDYGVPGIVDSLENVEAAGMVGVGVGADEEEAYQPRIVEVAGWRVAVVGFGGVVPTPDWTARGDAPGQASGYDPALMAQAVEVAAADADLVIATVHWGEEGSFTPRPEDRTKADAMIAAGADVVFGHHAHRLQPLERVDEVPVFWNLGNFVWPNRSEDASRTAVASFTVEPGGGTEACLLPFRIDDGGVPRSTGDDPDCG